MTRRRFYTQALLHTEAFTHRRFYTQALLHTNTFTHKHFYTQTLLHADAFTHRRFYTQTLLHTNSFYKQIFHSQPFTSNTSYIAILPRFLHIEPRFVRKGCSGTSKIAILLQFLTIDLHFVRKGCSRTSPAQVNFTSVFDDRPSFRAKGLLQDKSGTSKIAILPQFLTIDLQFVRKGCSRTSPGQVKSQFFFSF